MNVAPQYNAPHWMDMAPQNQVIPLQSQYVMTPTSLHVINQAIYQTVYPIPQPLQYNPMPQNQPVAMPRAPFPGNHLVTKGGMNLMPQQQIPLNLLQGQLQQGPLQGGGIKRTLELDTVRNNKTQNIQLEETPVLIDNFGMFPDDLKREILKILSIRNLKEIDNLDKLKSMGNPIKLIKLVCKDWKSLVEGDKPFVFANEVIRSAYSLTDDEFEIYQRLVKGGLIYKPDERSDNGRIKLPISALWNPLEGTFDLSQCGEDAGKYTNISTGYRKWRRAENADKMEICFPLRFLIEKDLNTTAKHFREIYNSWTVKAPVGIIWIYGGDEGDIKSYDHLTTQSLNEICNKDVFEKWMEAVRYTDNLFNFASADEHRTLQKFHVYL